MRIFELHFNPKEKDDHFFDSFVFEPSNSLEKRIGSLYEIGEIKNGLPQNSKLLDHLAKAIKERYYGLSSKNSEKALSESLKKANEFLSQELKKDNVSWLGNLNFAVLSVKDYELNFTKTGDIKVLMLRQGQITDIGKNFDIEKIDPYPLKVFFNIISGKLAENDIVFVITKDIYNYLNEKKIFQKIMSISDINEKKIKELFPEDIFSANKEKGIKPSGICFLFFVKKEKIASLIRNKKFLGQIKKKKFSYKDVFEPVIKPILNFKNKLLSFKLTKPKLKSEKKQDEAKIKNLAKKQELPLYLQPKRELAFKNKIILLAGFLVLLFLGFLVSKGNNIRINFPENSSFKKIEEKISQAQNNLISKNYQNAEQIFREAWQELDPLIKTNKKRALSLRQSIEEELGKLNNSEKIENPNLFYQMKDGLKPDKMFFSGTKFYFFNSKEKNLYVLNLEEESFNELEIDSETELLAASENSLFQYKKPDIFYILKNGNLEEKPIAFTSSKNISQMVFYYKNLYFLDEGNCDILKVSPELGPSLWPRTWLKYGSLENCQDIISISAENNLWILRDKNSIDVYYKGEFQKTLKIDTFPFLSNPVKIETKIDSSYLYILEPDKKRLIITNKEDAKVFKQITSDKFDNLQDFEVSDDGKEIYLLNGNKIYSIKIDTKIR